MKKIGIIGGSGALATGYLMNKVFTYSINNYASKEDSDFPYVVFVNNPNINIDYKGKFNESTYNNLLKEVNNLVLMGCNYIGFACNTVQLFIPKLSTEFPNVKFITAEDTLNNLDNFKVGVICSRKSKADNLFEFLNNTIYLDEDNQQLLDVIISDTIGLKNIDNNKVLLEKIINNFLNNGVDKIIIGCSEISVIKTENNILIDTMDLLAKEINRIYKGY